jgi:hypothetical protein
LHLNEVVEKNCHSNLQQYLHTSIFIHVEQSSWVEVKTYSTIRDFLALFGLNKTFSVLIIQLGYFAIESIIETIVGKLLFERLGVSLFNSPNSRAHRASVEWEKSEQHISCCLVNLHKFYLPYEKHIRIYFVLKRMGFSISRINLNIISVNILIDSMLAFHVVHSIKQTKDLPS